MQLTRIVVSGVLVLLFAAMPGVAAAMEVYATILPQKYFIERIGGDLVDVHVLVQPGANPHMYEPTPKQMAALTRAKVYFAVGVTLEDSWLPRIKDANSDLVVIHTDAGIEKLSIEAHEHEHGHGYEVHEMHAGHDHATHDHSGHDHAVHDHDNDHATHKHGEDDHDSRGHDSHGAEGGMADPHIWLDPLRVKDMAVNIYNGLVLVDPGNEATYKRNLDTFVVEADALHAAVQDRLTVLSSANRVFLVFHPSWGYFADRYGLTQIAVEEGGNEPSPAHLAKVIRRCREMGIRVVFVQPQFSQRSAEVIASEIGGHVVPLDPLAEDWESNLRKAADAFVAGAQ